MLRKDKTTLAVVKADLQSLVSEFQQRIRYGELKDEEDITSRFLERLQGLLTFSRGALRIETKALTFKKQKEEPVTGADVLVVTRYQAPQIDISKGFLAQAKKLEIGKKVYGQDWVRLCNQCEKMLNHSVESYVWLYSSSSIRSHKAFEVKALNTQAPDDLSYMYLKDFLYEFLISRHGDPNIDLSDAPRLNSIVEDLNVKFVLAVSVVSGMDPGPHEDGPIDPDGGPSGLGQLLENLGAETIKTNELGLLRERRAYEAEMMNAFWNPLDEQLAEQARVLISKE